MGFHGLFGSLITWHGFIQSTSISGVFLLGRSVICLSLIIPSGKCAWGTQVSCSSCAQRNDVLSMLFVQLWLLSWTKRYLLAAALLIVALGVALGEDSGLHLQLYRESFLCCSAMGTLVFILGFLTHSFNGLRGQLKVVCWFRASFQFFRNFFHSSGTTETLGGLFRKTSRSSCCSVIMLAFSILSIYADLHEHRM